MESFAAAFETVAAGLGTFGVSTLSCLTVTQPYLIGAAAGITCIVCTDTVLYKVGCYGQADEEEAQQVPATSVVRVRKRHSRKPKSTVRSKPGSHKMAKKKVRILEDTPARDVVVLSTDPGMSADV